MKLSDIVVSERRTGFARFAGSRAAIVVPVRQSVIDEVLPLLPGVPRGLTVGLTADQRVRGQLGAFHAEAYVHPAVQLSPAPIVRLELASQLVAFGLRRVSLPPFVQVVGREVRIDVGAIPALAEVADLWPLVERLTITAGAQAWELAVHLHVAPTGAPSAPMAPSVARPTRTQTPQVPSALLAWARRQWASGLPAADGARLTAHVRASVDALNDWLADALRYVVNGGMSTTSVRGESDAPDMARLAGLVRQLRVDAAPGAITLDVEAGAGD